MGQSWRKNACVWRSDLCRAVWGGHRSDMGDRGLEPALQNACFPRVGCAPMCAPPGHLQDGGVVDLPVVDEDMGVGVEGDAGAGVAGAFGDFTDRDAVAVPHR